MPQKPVLIIGASILIIESLQSTVHTPAWVWMHPLPQGPCEGLNSTTHKAKFQVTG